MKRNIKLIIGMIALAVVVFSQPFANTAEDLRLTVRRASANQPAVLLDWPVEAGAIYQVLSSANLRSWQLAASGITNGKFAFPTEYGACYFRVQKLEPALTVAKGAIPDSAILIAGSTGNYLAQFRFGAAIEGFTIDKLKFQVPWDFAFSTAGVYIKYKNRAGMLVTSPMQVFITNAESQPSVAYFTGLNMYVSADDDATLDVYVDMANLAASGFSGAAGAITMLADVGFRATGDSGTLVTTIGSADLTGNTFYVRKSKPTFAKLDAGTDPVNGPLYRFSVVADPAGNIEIKQLCFSCFYSGCFVTDLYLYDPATLTVLTDTPADLYAGEGFVELPIGSWRGDLDSIAKVLTVGTVPKILEVRGTVTGYREGGSYISIGFRQDTFAVPDDQAVFVGGGNIWSDRSATAHTVVHTDDWHNGYLLKDMTGVQQLP